MRKIKIQGPRLEDCYYKTVEDPAYITTFTIDGEPKIAYKTLQLPNTDQLWNLEMAQLYPSATLAF
jgi:hypothetical protein